MAQSEEKIEKYIIMNVREIMKDIQNFLDEYICRDDCNECEHSRLCKWSTSIW